MRLHQGEITVESALDEGTTFTVRLPCGSAFGASASDARASGAARMAARSFVDESGEHVAEHASPSEHVDSATILVADDNADMRTYMAGVLTAYARELDRKRALEVGFQAHVSKPVEPTELVRVVASFILEPKL